MPSFLEQSNCPSRVLATVLGAVDLGYRVILSGTPHDGRGVRYLNLLRVTLMVELHSASCPSSDELQTAAVLVALTALSAPASPKAALREPLSAVRPVTLRATMACCHQRREFHLKPPV